MKAIDHFMLIVARLDTYNLAKAQEDINVVRKELEKIEKKKEKEK